MSIIITKSEFEIIKKHAADTFPYEACGGLLGRIEGDSRIVVKAYPAENRYGKITWDSFEIEPNDILNMDKLCVKENLDILGFYHTHPNHPAIPSNFDINASWPFYSYVILSLKGNSPDNVTDIRSYLMADRISEPVEEEVIIK